MPKVQRRKVPKAVIAHLLLRIEERSIKAAALEQLTYWLDTNPEVPAGKWFKRFQTMTVCGTGPLLTTILEPGHVAVGEEV